MTMTGMQRWAHDLFLLLLLAVPVAACGGPQKTEPVASAPPSSSAPAAPASRPAFVAPDLASVDASVREQIAGALARVEKEGKSGGAAAATAWLRLGQLYQAYDLLEPAAAAYENALFETPGDPHLVHGLALVRQRQGRLEDAARLLRQEIAARPSAAASYRLGQVEKAAGKAAEARSALESARSLDPGCVAATYELGLLAVQEGQLEPAVSLFEEVLKKQPTAVQAHFPLGQALQRLGRQAEAKPHLAASAARELSVGGRAACSDAFEAELRPLATGAAAYIMRSQAARLAGRTEEALAELRQAVTVAPSDPIAHQALGKLLAGQGQLEAALGEYRKAVELDPAAAELKVDLGLLLEQSGDRAAAGKLFREALAKNENLAPAHFGQARLALAEGKPGPALEALGQVLQLEPANDRARGLRAELLIELKRPEEALEDVRHLLDQSPPADPMEHASLAWAAAALGDRERAARHLEKVAAQEDAPARARAAAHFRLASLKLEAEGPAAARAELEAALALDPSLEPARQMLGRLP